MSQISTTLSTSGMHCGSCAMLIDMTLGDLDGVIESHTDHASGETSVVYDDERVSMDQIIQAIRGAGYEAEPVG